MSLKGTENVLPTLIVSEELEQLGIIPFEDDERRKPTLNAFGFVCAELLRERKAKNDLYSQIQKNKKKFAVLSVCVLIASIACGIFVSSWYTTKREIYIADQISIGHLPVELSFSVDSVAYNSLGTDVTVIYRCQGREWKTGDVIKTGKECIIEAKIIEKDPSADDKATGKIRLSSLPSPGKDSIKITVNEKDGGGHKGSATYRVTCWYQPKISIWAVLAH